MSGLRDLFRRRPPPPLREMTAVARRWAEGDLAPRLPAPAPGELRDLAEALNAAAARLESRLAELKRLERVRIDFVANVSHELRTPLTSIKGFVETLRDGALSDPEAAGRFLDIIQRHTDRIIAVVDDLLTLSQAEAPEAPLVLSSVDLAALVEEVAQGLAPQRAEKGLALSMDLARPAVLTADLDRLSHVVSNLLDNAAKYTPTDGRISVRLRTEAAGLLLEVSDTGVGIPAGHLDRIFERFYRADKARSREMGGTGLGLAIVKHIVQAHGGSVAVTSAPGQGSTFSIRLPIR